MAIYIEEKILNNFHPKETGYSDYEEREEKLISLSNTIRDKMGIEQSIFMQYEELSTLNENALLKNIYKQGLTDGFNLLREIYLSSK